MPKEHVLIFLPEAEIGQSLLQDTLQPAGYEVTLAHDLADLERQFRRKMPHVLILGDQYPLQMVAPLKSGLEVAAQVLQRYPLLPIIFVAQPNHEQAIQALRLGAADYLTSPVRTADVLQAVRRALKRYQQLKDFTRLEVRRNTQSLQQRVSGLEMLQKIGRSITASLDLDTILSEVVEAAVQLSGAEEGSLLLLDEASGELYMHAARNFGEDFVRTFRLPAADSLAGEVLHTGKPLRVDEKTPRKIKTAYLVQHLIYVPLTIKERVIGVLGVDKRQSSQPFSEEHVRLISALAGFAAIAIENARLYNRSEIERQKLETILTKIGDGVIVLDQDKRLMLINQAACQALKVEQEHPIGRPLKEVISHPDLVETVYRQETPIPGRCEFILEDGRVVSAQVTPIPAVGLVVTLQDITHLKELDRLKSDFVNAVSHDLRSPLTAILGYTELIGRVGSLNAQQKEFIRRVENNVHSITALINDLLDLGRIEAGFDSRKEIVSLATIIHVALDGQRQSLAEKSQRLLVEISENLPAVLGNPIHLRQMLANLVENAIKYNQEGGEIRLRAHAESDQIILQVSDNGPGIPLAEQPYIFDKFYRASNVPVETPGTGLGLAIVKSIVENHHGRIWVDSTPGQGTTFTVVLPSAK